MTPAQPEVVQVLCGRAIAFGPGSAFRSSITTKTPLAGPARVTPTGIAGDEQGNPVHHGGIDLALHQYPLEHYAQWRAERAHGASLFGPGGFGENLSSRGMDEAGVCIGDAYRCGSALLQVSRTRHPCWRLNVRFGDPAMARRVQESGRYGWYYRVLEEGEIRAGDRFTLEERPNPAWPVARLIRVMFTDPMDFAQLEQMAALPQLAKSSRDYAVKRLASRELEDWTGRLETPRVP